MGLSVLPSSRKVADLAVGLDDLLLNPSYFTWVLLIGMGLCQSDLVPVSKVSQIDGQLSELGHEVCQDNNVPAYFDLQVAIKVSE